MRKNFGVKSWVYPQPVLMVATYDESGKANVMNAAWGGQYDTTQVMLCLGEHQTTKNIRAKGAFTVSFADVEHMVACDYVGIVSGTDEPRKMEKSGLHTSKAEMVDAPVIDELPLTLECKLVKFNEDGIVVGEIVNISADERILDGEGKVDTAKLNAIIFDPVQATYRKVGETVGKAFHDGLQLK